MADDTFAGKGWNSVLRANRPSYVQCDRVVEATLYPGQPAIKGTSAHQLTQAAEDALNVVGVPECQNSVDIDTAMVAGSDIEDFYYLTSCAIVAGYIQANKEAIVMGDRLTVSDLDGVDLVVMGSPTHRMNLPEAVRPVFEALPRRVLRGAPVAAFDTSYKMSAWLARFTAAPKLAQKLRKLGGKRVVPPETFHVVEREGPLYDGEIERAKAWAEVILGRIA